MKDLLIAAAGVAVAGTAAAVLASHLSDSAVSDVVASAAEDVMDGALELAASATDAVVESTANVAEVVDELNLEELGAFYAF